MNGNSHDAGQPLTGRLQKGPVGFRKSLQQLGPTFNEFGRFLALRPDLIARDYREELLQLRDRVPPFSWQQASAIIMENFGREPAEIFPFINPKPVSAGAFTQTHLARLSDGTEVTLKILRPGINDRVQNDLKRSRLFSRLLKISGAANRNASGDIIQEFADWISHKTDLSRELENLTRLYRLTQGSSFVKVPRPYRHFCSPGILTVEHLRGIPLREIPGDRNAAQRVERNQVSGTVFNREQLANNLITASLRQIFRYKFFINDLHPDNIIALPGNLIGFGNFAPCTDIDESLRQKQVEYFSAAIQHDTETLFNLLLKSLRPGEGTDIEALRRDFTSETSTWMKRQQKHQQISNGSSSTSGNTPMAQWMIGTLGIARDNALNIPPSMLPLFRTLITAEENATRLHAQVSLQSAGKQFFSTLQLDELLETIEPTNLQPAFLSLASLLRDSPGQLHEILSEVADGRFSLNVNISESPKVEDDRNRRVQMLVTAILSVSVALLLTIPELPSPFGISLTWPLRIGLIGLYLIIFVQWRHLR